MVAYIKTLPNAPTARNRHTRRFWGRRWHEASTAFLRQYPFCVLCLHRGMVNDLASDDPIATQRSLVVDHITPHRGNGDLFWEQTNWQTLCRLCHDRDKRSVELRGEDWRAYLRSEADRCNAWRHVEQYSDWLPSGVKMARLGGPVGGG